MKNTSDTTTAQRIFIWMLVVLLPLIHSSETIEPDAHLKLMFASGISMIFILYNYLKDASVKVITNIVIICFACFILYSITGLSGNNFPDALFEWNQLFIVFITVFIFSNYIKWEVIVAELPKAFSVLALILVAAGIKDLIGVIREGQLVIPGNTYSLLSLFGHRNLFAQMLFFAFPFTMYALVFSKGKLWQLISFLSVSLSLFFLIILSNRATWIALIAGGFAVIITHLFFIKYRKDQFNNKADGYYKRLAASIIIGALLAASFYLKFSDVASVKEHTADIVNFEKGSTKDHLFLWKKSIELIREHPLIGNGLASWKVEILKYGNEGLVSENNATFYQTPHNDFLWIWSQEGLLGIIIYVLLVVIIGFNIFKNLRNAGDQNDFVFMNLLQFLFIGYIIYSFFSFPKERLEDFLILGIIAGCSVLFPGVKRQFYLEGSRRHLIIWLSCILLLTCTFLGFTRYRSEIHLAKALKAKAENNNLIIIREIPKAYSFFYRMDPVSTPLKWYSGSALFNLGRYDEALADLQQAYELNPYHIHVLNNLASCYEVLGDHRSAIKFYKSAVNIAPNFEDAWLNLCAIYFNLHDLDKAYESLSHIDLKTTNPKFSQFVMVVLQSRLTEIARKNNDEKMQKILNEKAADAKWFMDLHINSIKKHLPPENFIN